MRKPHPDRVQATWDRVTGPISDEEADAEMERIMKMSSEDVARELVEAGFDLRKVDADAERLRERVLASLAESPRIDEGRSVSAVDAIAPRLPVRRRRVEAFTGVALALVACAMAFALLRKPHEVPIARPDPSTFPVPSGLPAASSQTPTAVSGSPAELRARAKTACDNESWLECQRLLDEATRVDPAGERTSEVRELRNQLENNLRPIGAKP